MMSHALAVFFTFLKLLFVKSVFVTWGEITLLSIDNPVKINSSIRFCMAACRLSTWMSIICHGQSALDKWFVQNKFIKKMRSVWLVYALTKSSLCYQYRGKKLLSTIKMTFVCRSVLYVEVLVYALIKSPLLPTYLTQCINE